MRAFVFARLRQRVDAVEVALQGERAARAVQQAGLAVFAPAALLVGREAFGAVAGTPAPDQLVQARVVKAGQAGRLAAAGLEGAAQLV